MKYKWKKLAPKMVEEFNKQVCKRCGSDKVTVTGDTTKFWYCWKCKQPTDLVKQSWRATVRKYVPECESKHAKKMVMKYGGYEEVKSDSKFIKGV